LCGLARCGVSLSAWGVCVMAGTAASELDGNLYDLVSDLADGMFPLAQWVAQKTATGGYKPRRHVPWREDGHPLTVRAAGAIAFLDELLERSIWDEPVVARFVQVMASPLTHSPIPDVAGWRKARGLDPPGKAKFGIVAAQNVIASPDGTTPVTRAQFYAPYWPLLQQAVKAAKPKSPKDWQDLASALMADTSAHWPSGQPFKSSPLIKQLARDLLHGMLNMRNPAPDPWRTALLEELGEARRVGNAFTPDEVRRKVEALREKIKNG
jgi:hypothetical protein